MRFTPRSWHDEQCNSIPDTMTNCIFCDILAGRAPATFVYRDDRLAAFMDIRPVRTGQVLIVPHAHIDHFSDLPDDEALDIFRFGQKLARAMRRSLELRRVGMVVHGFGVPHAHLVVLPLMEGPDITSAQNAVLVGGEIRFRWEQVPLAPRAELERTAQVLRTALNKLSDVSAR
jgi:histidine triad (HIT) family protein